jgi:NAD(P)H dehydrogenase (quinone)
MEMTDYRKLSSVGRRRIVVEDHRKVEVLVLGSSGQVGKKIVAILENAPGISLRITSRRPEEVEAMKSLGKNAVHLDLDKPETFGTALAGVDRLFLLTGYTVAMLAQSKTLIDAASKAGVEHIVHLGVFAEWDTTDPHFTWHQLVESYIKSSGIAWTNIHPNMFMENLSFMFDPKRDAVTTFWREHRMGWIAAADIAAVAANVLQAGPAKHHGKDYWLSAEVAAGPDLAAIFSEVLGREISYDLRGPDEFKEVFTSGAIAVESWYADGGVEFMRQVVDGRMGYIGSIQDDVPHVTGRAALTLKEWISEHREQLAPAVARSE